MHSYRFPQVVHCINESLVARRKGVPAHALRLNVLEDTEDLREDGIVGCIGTM